MLNLSLATVVIQSKSNFLYSLRENYKLKNLLVKVDKFLTILFLNLRITFVCESQFALTTLSEVLNKGGLIKIRMPMRLKLC